MAQKTLDNKVEEELTNARKYAEEGDASLMEICLNSADEHNIQKVDIRDKKEEIKKVGYRNAIKVELTNARKYAEEGNATLTETCLSLAKSYAQKSNQDISTQASKVGELGYKNAVPIKLVSARKYAEEGNATLTETCLNLAKSYAGHIKQDITKEVDEIMASVKKK